MSMLFVCDISHDFGNHFTLGNGLFFNEHKFKLSALAMRLVGLYFLNYQCLDSLYADFQVSLCIFPTMPTFVHK